MSVKKYHSVDEMPGPRVFPPLDSENLRRLGEVNALAELLYPFRVVPGVQKFRSIEEASRHRQDLLLQRIHGR